VLQAERLGKRSQLLPLASVDRLEPAAEPRASPCLDLADNERGAARDDEIELADPAPPVASDDAVAARDVEAFDGRLAATADLGALVHDPTIGSWADMAELVTIVDGTPTPEEYAAFRSHVRWPAVDPAQAAEGLRASLASVLARDVDGTLVGIGRVVGDGGVYLYLQDVIVLERWRNNGIGTRITEALLDHVRELGGPGTFVGLMAAAGAGPFYERFRFQPRGEDRPGMWLTL
jgi:GNAT superfamily N-acetyltransferase